MGRKVWVPAVSGPLSAYAAGFCVVVDGGRLLAVGDRRTGCISSISSAAGLTVKGLPSGR